MAYRLSTLPLNRARYSQWIGIDPGVNTGIAIWYRPQHELAQVASMPIHLAMEWIKSRLTLLRNETIIRVEDARQRTWFGKTGPEVWKGAGSICRDAGIWEDFLETMQVDFEMVAPRRNKTKVKQAYFEQLTGWLKPTNEHGRDAAMLVYGY